MDHLKYLEKHGYPKTVKDLDKHKFISFGRGAPSPVYNPDWALKLGMQDNKKRRTSYEGQQCLRITCWRFKVG